MLKAHSRLFEHMMLAADLAAVALCWLLAYVLRFYIVGPPLVTSEPPPLRDYLLQLLPILGVWAVAFQMFDLYRPRRLGSYFSEWRDIAKASTLGVLVLIAGMSFVFREYEYSRLVIVYFWVLSIIGASFLRGVFREALRFARRRGYNVRRAFVVGGGEPIHEVVAMLRRRPDLGIHILGFFSDKPDVGCDGVRWLGEVDAFPAVLAAESCDLAIIALPHAESARVPEILRAIGDAPIAIHLVPDIYGLATLRGGIEEFDGVPFIHLRDSPLYGWNRLAKRAVDVVFGGLALGVTLPLWAMIAFAIRLTSPGPVFLRQERMGLDGQRFEMLKFRTMRLDAESETGPVWARPDDPRRTRFGAFLRRFSLDELPQLVNVMRGEMSLVGPRPERPIFVEEFRMKIPGYMLRHKVKAGITGWAQIHGWRGNTSLEKRIEYDLYYIERWSLALDLRILVETVWRGWFNRNAY